MKNETALPDIVVGSGPVGIAAADLLLRQGHSVILVDGGVDLEPERRQKIAVMAEREPHDWTRDEIEFLLGGSSASSKGVQKKLLYGSDFPYREVSGSPQISEQGLGMFSPSFAQGGFSHVWGAAALRYVAADIHDWPARARELEPHYRDVLQVMPVTGASDGLSETFGDGVRPAPPFDSQFKAMTDRWSRKSSELVHRGWSWGAARLAFDSPACRMCGYCLFGCPYRLIFSTESWRTQLQKNPRLSYRPGHLVINIREAVNRAILDVSVGGSMTQLEGRRVFLAAGPIVSSALVSRLLQSMPDRAEAKEFHFATSEYFIAPLLSWRNHHLEQPRISLAQVFAELANPETSRYLVHTQIYGYSELYKMALKKMLRRLGAMAPYLQSLVLGRMMVVQGYLHSHDSSKIYVRVNSDGAIKMTAEVNPHAKHVIKKVSRHLAFLARAGGATFIRWQVQIGRPGEGRHVGASFPMHDHPAKNQSDLLGRAVGLKRVHMVDSSVLPSLPATTFTLSAMANARRIISDAQQTLSN